MLGQLLHEDTAISRAEIRIGFFFKQMDGPGERFEDGKGGKPRLEV